MESGFLYDMFFVLLNHDFLTVYDIQALLQAAEANALQVVDSRLNVER
jgi:hypothetical protein